MDIDVIFFYRNGVWIFFVNCYMIIYYDFVLDCKDYVGRCEKFLWVCI